MFVECFAVKLSPLGGLLKHIYMWITGFNSRYEPRLVTLSNYSAMVAEWLRQERNSLCGWYFSYKFFLNRLWTEDLINLCVCLGESIEIVSEYIIYVRQHGFESRS